MSLTGAQFKQLQAALLDAFDYAGLEQMVYTQLGVHLEEVALGDNLTKVTFDLMQWAERSGRTPALIAGALAANQANPKLKQFAEQYAAPGPPGPSDAAGPDRVPASSPPQPRIGAAHWALLFLSILAPVTLVAAWVLSAAGANAARLSDPLIFYLLLAELTLALGGCTLLWGLWLYPRWQGDKRP